MNKLALAALILASAPLSGSALARTFRLSGTICYHTAGSFAQAYDQFGVHNIGNSSLTVECPLPLSSPSSGAAPAVTQVLATVYDRSTSADVTCSLEEVNQNGVILASMFNQTQGGFPGAGPTILAFVPPAGADASGYWRLRCTLPGIETAGAFSHLTTIVVKTSE